MGRPKRDEVWKHYRVLDGNSAMCSFCDNVYKKPNVNKMETHLLKCVKCPVNVKEELQSTVTTLKDVNVLNNNVQEDKSKNSFTSSEGPCSAEYKRELNSDLAKAIFVTGAPLAMVEHPLWIQFFEKLQPEYKMPTRKTLSTTALDKMHMNMHKELTKDFEAQNFLHLQCGGWSNVRNAGIINFLISKPEPAFVKSLDTTTHRHTGEYLANEILNVMSQYGPNKFVVLVGDNAKNVQKAFRIVKTVHSQVVNINCASHTMNLLCQDILAPNVLKVFINLTTDCIKAVKRSQTLVALLAKIVQEKGAGETLKLPCKTRWGSHCTSLKSLQNTRIALQTFAVHEDGSNLLRSDVKAALLDEDFWKMINQCIALLEPITAAIFKFESDNYNMHTVFITLKNMKSQLQFAMLDINIIEDDDKEAIMTAVENRTAMCIKPIHLAAYLLDPANQGAELDQGQESDAIEFIYNMGNELHCDIMPNLAQYRAKEGLWSKNFVWSHVGSMNAVTWWKGICGSKLLSKVAIRVLTAPCTSAAVERSFSVQSNIHSKKRNRLTSKRASKIAFISYNWNLQHRHIEDDDSDDDVSRCSSSMENENSDTEFIDINNFCEEDDVAV
jgi:hypothetical protein